MKTNKAIDIQLNKLGIYELRNLAREAGVKAPTTKRRETLIEQIKENIESGAFTPDLTKKAGRPAKRFYKVENMLTGFLTNSDNELGERLNCFDNRDSLDGYFSQSLEFDDVEDEIIDAQGILRTTSKGTYYFMNNKGNKKIFVVVPPEEIRKCSLIEGDMVEGQANYIAQRNMGMMSEIQTVNSKKPKDNKAHNEPKYEIPTSGLPNFPIMEGQGLVFAADTLTFVDNMSRFVSDLTKKGYTCIGLGLELNMEQKLKLERITNLKLIASMFEDKIDVTYELITSTIAHAKALLARGEKVVLFVLDIMSIYTILDLYFTSKGHGVAISHTLETIQTIKNLIGGSRVCENGSISIVANYNPDEKEKFAKEVNDIRKLVVCQLN